MGVLAVDKPAGMTSRDVVNQVQRLLRRDPQRSRDPIDGSEGRESPTVRFPPIKVGHTGTLDPMATGVLLLVVGQATRLVDYAHGFSKTYEADFLLGFTSDTLDSSGQVQPSAAAAQVSRTEMEEQLIRWQGNIWQTPPKYSAVHVDGKRAHDLARRGEQFQIPARQVTIHELKLLHFDFPSFSLRIRCSTGTYVRSLGADIAAALGSDAIMTRLVRTEIGPYLLGGCIPLQEIATRQDVIRHLGSALPLLAALPKASIEEIQCQQLRQGKRLTMSGPLDSIVNRDGQQAVLVDSTNRPVAIVEAADGQLRPIRVFNKWEA
jgi:tRNA pseudouridine55 synthase